MFLIKWPFGHFVFVIKTKKFFDFFKKFDLKNLIEKL